MPKGMELALRPGQRFPIDHGRVEEQHDVEQGKQTGDIHAALSLFTDNPQQYTAADKRERSRPIHPWRDNADVVNDEIPKDFSCGVHPLLSP